MISKEEAMKLAEKTLCTHHKDEIVKTWQSAGLVEPDKKSTKECYSKCSNYKTNPPIEVTRRNWSTPDDKCTNYKPIENDGIKPDHIVDANKKVEELQIKLEHYKDLYDLEEERIADLLDVIQELKDKLIDAVKGNVPLYEDIIKIKDDKIKELECHIEKVENFAKELDMKLEEAEAQIEIEQKEIEELKKENAELYRKWKELDQRR